MRGEKTQTLLLKVTGVKADDTTVLQLRVPRQWNASEVYSEFDVSNTI